VADAVGSARLAEQTDWNIPRQHERHVRTIIWGISVAAFWRSVRSQMFLGLELGDAHLLPRSVRGQGHILGAVDFDTNALQIL
jgi:hypothetical protein